MSEKKVVGDFCENEIKENWLREQLESATENFVILDYEKKLTQSAIKFFKKEIKSLAAKTPTETVTEENE